MLTLSAPRTKWPPLRKRLLLGLFMLVVSILSGWSLPPHLVVDKATRDWYTQQ